MSGGTTTRGETTTTTGTHSGDDMEGGMTYGGWDDTRGGGEQHTGRPAISTEKLFTHRNRRIGFVGPKQKVKTASLNQQKKQNKHIRNSLHYPDQTLVMQLELEATKS